VGKRFTVLTATRLDIVRERWAALTARYPWLGWVEKWGISTGSLMLGVLTLLVFRRGIEYFPWFVGYLLLLWLAGVALAEVRQSLLARGRRAISLVVDYTVQTLFHGLLLFLLPIYYTSRATFARAVIRLEPVQPVSSLPAEELRAWGGVAALTAVAAPAGLREPIYHVWRKEGAVVERIALSPVRGGLRTGFRTYSRKTDFGQDPAGSWTVDVLTAHDQLIGRIRLKVTP